MALWNEVASPEELTIVARAAADQREQDAAFSLSQFLPNVYKQDKYVTLGAGDNGLVEIAEYRAYDAETPIGGRGENARRVTLELPALGQKRRVSEYDQLNRLGIGGEAAIRESLGKAAVARGRAVADRIELERGRVLVSGKSVIAENGFFGDADFRRDEELTVTAATPWSTDGANTIEDLLAWAETYSDKNGTGVGYIVASTKVASALARDKAFLPKESLRTRATLEEVNALLLAEGLPQIVKYDRKVRVNGKAERVIPEDKVLILPEEATEMGATYFGTTLEALDPNYGIATEDAPGIVVGSYKDDDPLGVWVRASAIGLPALADANLAMVATVL